MDNALYIAGLVDEEQPALNVRRMKGYPKRPTDEQMLEYYSQLIRNLGGEAEGQRNSYQISQKICWKSK